MATAIAAPMSERKSVRKNPQGEATARQPQLAAEHPHAPVADADRDSEDQHKHADLDRSYVGHGPSRFALPAMMLHRRRTAARKQQTWPLPKSAKTLSAPMTSAPYPRRIPDLGAGHQSDHGYATNHALARQVPGCRQPSRAKTVLGCVTQRLTQLSTVTASARFLPTPPPGLRVFLESHVDHTNRAAARRGRGEHLRRVTCRTLAFRRLPSSFWRFSCSSAPRACPSSASRWVRASAGSRRASTKTCPTTTMRSRRRAKPPSSTRATRPTSPDEQKQILMLSLIHI